VKKSYWAACNKDLIEAAGGDESYAKSIMPPFHQYQLVQTYIQPLNEGGYAWHDDSMYNTFHSPTENTTVNAIIQKYQQVVVSFCFCEEKQQPDVTLSFRPQTHISGTQVSLGAISVGNNCCHVQGFVNQDSLEHSVSYDTASQATSGKLRVVTTFRTYLPETSFQRERRLSLFLVRHPSCKVFTQDLHQYKIKWDQPRSPVDRLHWGVVGGSAETNSDFTEEQSKKNSVSSLESLGFPGATLTKDHFEQRNRLESDKHSSGVLILDSQTICDRLSSVSLAGALHKKGIVVRRIMPLTNKKNKKRKATSDSLPPCNPTVGDCRPFFDLVTLDQFQRPLELGAEVDETWVVSTFGIERGLVGGGCWSCDSDNLVAVFIRYEERNHGIQKEYNRISDKLPRTGITLHGSGGTALTSGQAGPVPLASSTAGQAGFIERAQDVDNRWNNAMIKLFARQQMIMVFAMPVRAGAEVPTPGKGTYFGTYSPRGLRLCTTSLDVVRRDHGEVNTTVQSHARHALAPHFEFDLIPGPDQEFSEIAPGEPWKILRVEHSDSKRLSFTTNPDVAVQSALSLIPRKAVFESDFVDSFVKAEGWRQFFPEDGVPQFGPRSMESMELPSSMSVFRRQQLSIKQAIGVAARCSVASMLRQLKRNFVGGKLGPLEGQEFYLQLGPLRVSPCPSANRCHDRTTLFMIGADGNHRQERCGIEWVRLHPDQFKDLLCNVVLMRLAGMTLPLATWNDLAGAQLGYTKGSSFLPGVKHMDSYLQFLSVVTGKQNGKMTHITSIQLAGSIYDECKTFTGYRNMVRAWVVTHADAIISVVLEGKGELLREDLVEAFVGSFHSEGWEKSLGVGGVLFVSGICVADVEEMMQPAWGDVVEVHAGYGGDDGCKVVGVAGGPRRSLTELCDLILHYLRNEANDDVLHSLGMVKEGGQVTNKMLPGDQETNLGVGSCGPEQNESYYWIVGVISK
jgi:hypothetical protein